MESAIIGILGLLLGIIFTELIRRRNRIENYSQKIFEKRFEVYEKLFQLVDSSYRNINDFIVNKSLPLEERFLGSYDEGMKVIKYCSDNRFYLSEEIVVLIGSAIVNTSTIFESNDENEIEEVAVQFRLDIREIETIIQKESGIREINKHFWSIGKVKYKGPVIDYYKKLAEQYKIN
ncbi:MAG: hypothetical protein WC209_18370 [Ignavibacteriaceae bacterium]|jgi:hypothetical protein